MQIAEILKIVSEDAKVELEIDKEIDSGIFSPYYYFGGDTDNAYRVGVLHGKILYARWLQGNLEGEE